MNLHSWLEAVTKTTPGQIVREVVTKETLMVIVICRRAQMQRKSFFPVKVVKVED